MARIAEVAAHAHVTTSGKPAQAGALNGDLFSALVGDATATGAAGTAVEQTGLAAKLTSGEATSSAEFQPKQPAQKTDAATVALLAALPGTDPTATPTTTPATTPAGPSLPQGDAKDALVASPAAQLLGTDKPASKTSNDKSQTGGSDAASPTTADSLIQAQATPVAVVVPGVVDAPKTAPASGDSTDLLDASTRKQPASVATLKADGSTDKPGQPGPDPSSAQASSSDVSAGSQPSASSTGNQAASAAIAAKAVDLNQNAAQSVVSNAPGSANAGQPGQISGKPAGDSFTTKASDGKSLSDAVAAPDAKAAGTSSLQSSDGSSRDDKPVGAAVADAVKTAPAQKSDASVKSDPQQSSAISSTDASAQTSTVLNQVPTTVTPVQAQLAAVRATSDAAVPVDGLAVEIAARAKSGKTRFDIRLDPPELGRIDVRLDIDSQGKVTSHLTVDKPETLDLLRRDAPQLQQALSDSGFKTGDSGMQFSLRDQSFTGRNDQGNQGQQQQRAVPLLISEDDTVPAAVAGRSYRTAGAASGIDITI